MCVLCLSVLILVVFKFNKQKNTLKTTLNKHQCLFRVVFGVIYRLLNLNVTRVQSNFDGRNSGFEFTATVKNLHSKGLRRCPPDPMNNVKMVQGWPCREAFYYWYTTHAHTQAVTVRHFAQERHGIACECVDMSRKRTQACAPTDVFTRTYNVHLNTPHTLQKNIKTLVHTCVYL